ncbi:Hsp70 family protein [uncultured Paludibaculum sp.]|uniref:Hsp70 family protein n=1 Tax=uncultured Paludibaculum sp. TaxID=1765020 RepID=UPI002AAAC198|nr:Hsp70 family protein [uncultured Paludibaculum sp.]
MADTELVLGIDLGTTNSEIAAIVDGQVRVLGPKPGMLASCVGLTPSGELLVGQEARRQQLLYPERTVRSIKRKMGTDERVSLGERTFTPQEISAFILRELTAWARRDLGRAVTKAVITVPAYFSDAQRNATREAGALAGLEVVRILNEPTAASLAYGFGDGRRRTVLVYDLGGGTFDVSLVMVEGDVTEVLASHGNNRLGGDDFNDLLYTRLASDFEKRHGVSLNDETAARTRLWWAAEEAKKKLSFEPYAHVREENLVLRDGTPLHLDAEISRTDYEWMIRPLLDSTLDSVSKALEDARLTARDVDSVVLVGGSTRTPLVVKLLTERTGLEPLQDVHPDLCVALGAGVLASRLGGHDINRVLVDVSPYSFGPSYLGIRGGLPYTYCYRPIIRRNTPLPVTRTESYYTAQPGQTSVQIEIFQGDDEDALKNVPVGRFGIDGLRGGDEPSEVLCRMNLDLDGILHVTAIEKETGKSKHITIRNAFASKSPEEVSAARKHLEALWSGRETDFVDVDTVEEDAFEEGQAPAADGIPMSTDVSGRDEARQLLERSRRLLQRIHADDVEEAVALNERIETAMSENNAEELSKATKELRELLFFLEVQ